MRDATSYAEAAIRLEAKNAYYYLLLAQIQVSQKQFAKAAALYQKAFDLDKNSTLAMKLHGSLMASGKTAEAEAKVAQWLKEHPDDVGMRAYLAEGYMKQGQHKPAIAEYERILKVAPDGVLALNNLAWLYQQQKDKRAIALAEHAYKLQPDLPAVMDTLGWAHVELGDAQRGLSLLRQAYAKQPDQGTIHYHFAAALFKVGERQRAQAELERLLALGGKFSEEQEARGLLSQIKNTGKR